MNLRKIERWLRQASLDLWILTVDDPDTATRRSEAAGMTPRRRALRFAQNCVDLAVDAVETLINLTTTKES